MTLKLYFKHFVLAYFTFCREAPAQDCSIPHVAEVLDLA